MNKSQRVLKAMGYQTSAFRDVTGLRESGYWGPFIMIHQLVRSTLQEEKLL